jgi:hypothetical protein
MKAGKAKEPTFKEGDYVVCLRDDGADLPAGAVGRVLPYSENDYVGPHAPDRVWVRFPVPAESEYEGTRGMRPEWLRAATEDEILVANKQIGKRSVTVH